jgi:hypothetical protein
MHEPTCLAAGVSREEISAGQCPLQGLLSVWQVEVLGGRMGTVSRHGSGSTFWFMVPWAVPEAKQADPASAPVLGQGATASCLPRSVLDRKQAVVLVSAGT